MQEYLTMLKSILFNKTPYLQYIIEDMIVLVVNHSTYLYEGRKLQGMYPLPASFGFIWDILR